MAGIKKVKIKKKTYKFDVRRRYYSEKHYKVKEKSPVEKLREQLKKTFAPKKEEKKKIKRPTRIPKEKPPGFNFALAGVAIIAALIILIGGGLYFYMQSLQPTPGGFVPPVDKPQISNSLLGGSVLTAGDIGTEDNVASVLLSYDTENIGNYTVSLETYEMKLPSEVFVLQSSRDQASSYSSFMNHLRNNLSKKKILVNEITMQELETLPEGAVILIPSGAIPQEILGVDSTITFDNLANRGMVVIYIGMPFDDMHNGRLVVDTPNDVLDKVPFDFDESASLLPTQGFTLYQPLYRVTSGRWSSKLAYGCVSILTRENGAFIFIPQTLDGGWRQDPLIPGKEASEFAAEDIARIIVETPWAESDGDPVVYEIDVSENPSRTRYFYTNPFAGESRSVKMNFKGVSPSDSELFVEDTQVINLEKTPNGNLFIDGGVVVISTNITNQPVRMFARLDEPTAAQPNMYLVINDISGQEVERYPQGRVNVQSDLSIDAQIYLGKGEYTAELVDDESRPYAQSYMRVVTVDIALRGKEGASTYIFRLEREGEPVQLSSVEVIVDEGEYGTYDFTNVRGEVSIDVGGYTGGDALPTGEHTFTFVTGGLSENVKVDIVRPIPPFFANPYLWLTIIISAGIAGMGVIFSRREQTFYSVDIPDFPPVARQKIPLTSDTILSIFERVNESYRWENTPLTLSEVKNGFKELFYQGKPIYITDYNAEYLLDNMIGKGKVLQALGYYGPLSWENQTGKSMTYLAMMRKLRDICVNNAIPFTQLGESKEADSEITVVGQQMFLHFYERSSEVDDKSLAELLEKILSTIDKGITIVLFKNDIKKRNFIALLDSPSRAQLLLKLEVENRSVLLLTMEELENMIKELKNV